MNVAYDNRIQFCSINGVPSVVGGISHPVSATYHAANDAPFGKICDARLAMGIARQICDVFPDPIDVISHVEPKLNHARRDRFEQRRSVYENVKDVIREGLLDSVSSPGFKTVALSHYANIEHGVENIEGLEISQIDLDLHPGSKNKSDECVERRSIHLDIHAIQRLVMRCGVRNADALLDELEKVLPWCQTAMRVGKKCLFPILTDNGIYWCEYGRSLKDQINGKYNNSYVVRIITFISHDLMNDFTRGVYHTLFELGYFDEDEFPSFPCLMGPTDHHRKIMTFGIAAGDAWKRRRNHAKRRTKKQGASHEVFGFQ